MENQPPLPMDLPKPVRRRRARKTNTLLQACWESLCEFSLGPLGRYIWKEWRAVKRYPGILIIAMILAAAGGWYGAQRWRPQESRPPEPPYEGETSLKLFFPGDGGDPQLLNTQNIYRHVFYRAQIHHTLAALDENKQPITHVGIMNMWVIFLVFKQEVNYDVNSFQIEQTWNPPLKNITFREVGRRGASVMIAEEVPKGTIEIKVDKRPSTQQ